MDIDFYFVRDRVAAKTLNVQFCISQDKLVDIFNKPLVTNCFSLLRLSFRMIDTLSSRGGVLTYAQNQQALVGMVMAMSARINNLLTP